MNLSGRNPFFRQSWFARISGFVLHSGFMAAVLGTTLYLIIGFPVDPYVFDLVDESAATNVIANERTTYADLDHDSLPEELIVSNSSDSSSYLLIQSYRRVTLEQWNFDGVFADQLTDLLISDCNHDRKKEVGAITIKGNKIYLNVVEPYGGMTHQVRDRLVDSVSTGYGKPLMSLSWLEPVDLNHDGTDEVVFSLSSGYARQPRKVYAYDLVGDSLWSSPYGGSYLQDLQAFDLDGDGHWEITGTCTAPNNYTNETIFLQDSFSWFIIFDEQLKFKVQPVKMGPKFSVVFPLVLMVGDTMCYYVYSGYETNSGAYHSWFRLRGDFTLEPLADPLKIDADFNFGLKFQYPATGRGGAFWSARDKPVFLDSTGAIHKRTSVSNQFRVLPLQNPAGGPADFKYALLKDGHTVILAFFDGIGRRLATIPNDGFFAQTSVCWVGLVDGHYRLYVGGVNNSKWFSLRKNPWQYLRFLWLLAFIGGFYGFIELIRFTQTQELRKRESLKRQMLELQLKAAKNQLDPHFTFNALNGLSYLALTGDSVRVSNYIGNFSRLLRTLLNHSDKVLVPLGEEIDFVRNYIELQQLRFEDRLEFSLDIATETDTGQSVPKLIIQTHIENAIKHGLRTLLQDSGSRKGQINLAVSIKGADTILVIEDNGSGRGTGEAPGEERSGRGLKALERIYTNVRQLYGIEINQMIEDLFDAEGHPAGTRVRIRVRYR
jgi:hypothetical protein